MEEPMALRVTTLYLSSFNMPRSCVVCGSEPGLNTLWKIKGQKSNWSGKQTTTLNLDFPLCPECYAASRNKGLANLILVIGILISFGSCVITSSLINALMDNGDSKAYIGIFAGIAVLVVMLVLSGKFKKKINEKSLTPEQRIRRKQVNQSAKIVNFSAPKLFDKSGGSIVFEFENPAFAQEFSALNLGHLTPTGK